jgi:RNA polymerase sigma-70 factor (ECF subfamily)
MEADERNDLAAVRRVLGGETEAFREVVVRHSPGLFAYAGSLLPVHQDREDAVQDALVSAFRRLATFDPARGSLRGWLFVIVRNRARNLLRKKSPAPVARVPEPGPARRSEPEIFADLDRALARLPEEQRSAILLAEVQELPHAEVARALGVKTGTVKSRVSRAREKLRAALARAKERAT